MASSTNWPARRRPPWWTPQACLVCFTAALGTGCIPASTTVSFHNDYGHSSITSDVLEGLKPGVTTATGVRWNLGAPSAEVAGGRFLVYSWDQGWVTTYRWHWVLWKRSEEVKDGLIGKSVDGGLYHLVMQFSDDGTLLAHRVTLGGQVDATAAELDHVIMPTAPPD